MGADLTKNQYNIIRKYTTNFPSYYQIQNAKKDCYPPKEKIFITDSYAKIDMQALLDKTTERIFKTITPTVSNDGKTYILLSKWGCDGAADQAEYNMVPPEDCEFSDSSMFICSLVPLKLFEKNYESSVLWKNDCPGSTRYCRPIQFNFIKENKDNVKSIVGAINEEISNLVPYLYHNITIEYNLTFTMIDGKIVQYMTDTKSSMNCFVCGVSPKEMNNIEHLLSKPVKESNFCFGLSTLHAWIRCFECIIHVAYNLPFKSWSARSEEQKTLKKERKTEIQEQFRSKTGLLIDVVKQGKGTTNTGNTARKFFSNPQLSAQITGVDENLIARFSTILKCISSNQKIHIGKFKEYCLETAKIYSNLYGWYYMPVSVHKILIHGAAFIEQAVLPIGQLSEEAQEANHKLFRKYRECHSRKHSRKSNNEDVLNYLLLASDPVVSHLRPKLSTKNQELPENVLELLE